MVRHGFHWLKAWNWIFIKHLDLTHDRNYFPVFLPWFFFFGIKWPLSLTGHVHKCVRLHAICVDGKSIDAWLWHCQSHVSRSICPMSSYPWIKYTYIYICVCIYILSFWLKSCWNSEKSNTRFASSTRSTSSLYNSIPRIRPFPPGRIWENFQSLGGQAIA